MRTTTRNKKVNSTIQRVVRSRASTVTSTSTASPLIQALATTPVANIASTENGALSSATTTSKVLDLFASGGALRHEPEARIQDLFANAFAEDKLLATKVACYIRDVRGGQGQRKSFRAILKWLAFNAPGVLRKNLSLIAEYGRWDDVISLIDTSVYSDVIDLIVNQLEADGNAINKDGEGASISLLGKWLPSANTSSKATRRLAHKIMRGLGTTPRLYRKLLSALRAQINIVEKAMCAQNWSSINYEHVPSRASMIYRHAFSRHDPAGYSTWKGKAFRGEAKVNASALYPYDIVHRIMRTNGDETLELLWRGLPNLLTGSVHKGLVVCDVSGSMGSWAGYGGSSAVTPMDIALSLAIYFAERCEGSFKDYFITFSGNPQLQKLRGNTLKEKVSNLIRADWEMNTDVQKVFELILSRALANNLKQEDLPDAIYVVSDLQFDSCGYQETNLEAIKRKFAQAGYKAPLLVFWQVRASQDKVALKFEKGVAMVSGFSPNALTSILKLEQPKDVTPYDVMLATVNTERYEPISV